MTMIASHGMTYAYLATPSLQIRMYCFLTFRKRRAVYSKKYKKTSTYMYRSTPFKSDLINNMDHMSISGTEPSSVILMQNKVD